MLAAGQEHPGAILSLAACFQRGSGLDRDGEAAEGLLRTAALLGHEGAQRLLARAEEAQDMGAVEEELAMCPRQPTPTDMLDLSFGGAASLRGRALTEQNFEMAI
eukprot:scaffold57830_cov32-Prasinocladus_malaysianus.AAC.2